jgi:glycosyltransferase involved in cell wall biosynthesis
MTRFNYDKCCILIPFKDAYNLLYDCLGSVLAHLPIGVRVLLVDDGSEISVTNSLLSEVLAHPQVILLRHSVNRGAAAARNTGFNWCRSHDIEIVILLDSDCLVQPQFVEIHCDLHLAYPEITCIGGGIQGLGQGIWAGLDGLMSWFTSIPTAPMRQVYGIYHIPSTNMSLKLADLDKFEHLFDPQLRTGEDVIFVKRMIKAGLQVIYHPQPVIFHCDRNQFQGFLKHQWRWGLHTYVVRFNHRKWNDVKRFSFAFLFACCLPLFALFCTILISVPWVQRSPAYLKYLPLLFLVNVFKSVAVLTGIISPNYALRSKNEQENTSLDLRCNQEISHAECLEGSIRNDWEIQNL